MRTRSLRTGHMNRALAMIGLLASVVCPVSRAQTPGAQSTLETFFARQNKSDRGTAFHGGPRRCATFEVIAQGSGPVIVILPSLGRGAEDYNVVAALLARDGFRVLRPSRAASARAPDP